MSGDAMDWYRERLGDALHRVAHPHHPWSGCAYPDLFYDKLTHFMGDLAASGLTVRPALLADTPSVEPQSLEYAAKVAAETWKRAGEILNSRLSVEPAGVAGALAILDVIDGIVDDTHPEGDGCPLCAALDELRDILGGTTR